VKLYVRDNPEQHRVAQAVAIDPGLATCGIAYLNTSKINDGCWVDWDWFEDKSGKATTLALPELYAYAQERALFTYKKMFEQFESLDPSACDFIIEYPHLMGQFSTGLAVFICKLTQVLKDNDARRITYIPARIPEFFLKVRSVNGTQTVTFAKEAYGKSLYRAEDTPIRLKVHAADALLFLLFRYNKIITGLTGIPTRVPEWETIKLPY